MAVRNPVRRREADGDGDAGGDDQASGGSSSASVNRRRRKKLSRALVTAAMLGDARTAGRLLRRGAPPELPDADGTTPLYAASVQGAADVVAVLLTAGARPDTESGRGDEGTPLCAAACWGHTGTVRLLLAHGADPALREDHGAGLAALDWAQRGPHPETLLLTAAVARRPAPAPAPAPAPQ